MSSKGFEIFLSNIAKERNNQKASDLVIEQLLNYV